MQKCRTGFDARVLVPLPVLQFNLCGDVLYVTHQMRTEVMPYYRVLFICLAFVGAFALCIHKQIITCEL